MLTKLPVVDRCRADAGGRHRPPPLGMRLPDSLPWLSGLPRHGEVAQGDSTQAPRRLHSNEAEFKVIISFNLPRRGIESIREGGVVRCTASPNRIDVATGVNAEP